MKAKEIGAEVGRDIGYRTIRVGDTLKDRNSGITYRVDEYGRLVNEVVPDLILDEWDGNDYVIVKAETKISPISEEKPTQTDKETSETEERATSEKRPQGEPAKDKRGGRHFPAGSKFVWVDGKRKLVKPGETIPDGAANAPIATSDAGKLTDAELVKMLRDRGYTVTATKLIEL